MDGIALRGMASASSFLRVLMCLPLTRQGQLYALMARFITVVFLLFAGDSSFGKEGGVVGNTCGCFSGSGTEADSVLLLLGTRITLSLFEPTICFFVALALPLFCSFCCSIHNPNRENRDSFAFQHSSRLERTNSHSRAG